MFMIFLFILNALLQTFCYGAASLPPKESQDLEKTFNSPLEKIKPMFALFPDETPSAEYLALKEGVDLIQKTNAFLEPMGMMFEFIPYDTPSEDDSHTGGDERLPLKDRWELKKTLGSPFEKTKPMFELFPDETPSEDDSHTGGYERLPLKDIWELKKTLVSPFEKIKPMFEPFPDETPSEYDSHTSGDERLPLKDSWELKKTLGSPFEKIKPIKDSWKLKKTLDSPFEKTKPIKDSWKLKKTLDSPFEKTKPMFELFPDDTPSEDDSHTGGDERLPLQEGWDLKKTLDSPLELDKFLRKILTIFTPSETDLIWRKPLPDYIPPKDMDPDIAIMQYAYHAPERFLIEMIAHFQPSTHSALKEVRPLDRTITEEGVVSAFVYKYLKWFYDAFKLRVRPLPDISDVENLVEWSNDYLTSNRLHLTPEDCQDMADDEQLRKALQTASLESLSCKETEDYPSALRHDKGERDCLEGPTYALQGKFLIVCENHLNSMLSVIKYCRKARLFLFASNTRILTDQDFCTKQHEPLLSKVFEIHRVSRLTEYEGLNNLIYFCNIRPHGNMCVHQLSSHQDPFLQSLIYRLRAFGNDGMVSLFPYSLAKQKLVEFVLQRPTPFYDVFDNMTSNLELLQALSYTLYIDHCIQKERSRIPYC